MGYVYISAIGRAVLGKTFLCIWGPHESTFVLYSKVKVEQHRESGNAT